MDKNYKYIYGPVPSRRMGISVGVSPIPKKYCNYSCIYCQLGRTNNLTNKRQNFFDLAEIINEFKDYMKESIKFDVVTLVGEGEPTLYSEIGSLIKELKKLTIKPVAVITNGGLLYDKNVREALKEADIVLPSIDASNEETFKKINRPAKSIVFDEVVNGLIQFSKEYEGQLWIETMIIKDYNDNESNFYAFKEILDKINYDRLYINTPVRPPAEKFVEQVSSETIKKAIEILKGISIEQLISEGFYSEVEDDYEAILSIIRRHPMNQYEIRSFLNTRDCKSIDEIFIKLKNEKNVDIINYKNYDTYRLKV